MVCGPSAHVLCVIVIIGLTPAPSGSIHSQTATETASLTELCGLLLVEGPVTIGEALVMLSLRINGKMYSVDVEPETPLLWVIRDTIRLNQVCSRVASARVTN